ncbi:MAG: peptidoglycan DD-metalloendopeptidase family protein [Oscillospiraceae bacterium]|nr:peptidoglycan DD-metalloendopeptidase family protein [Oscillospiraceae bacterium]
MKIFIKRITSTIVAVTTCVSMVVSRTSLPQLDMFPQASITAEAAVVYEVVSPVKNFRVTSYIGSRQLNGTANTHYGLDIVPSNKNPDYTIYAAESGTVLEVHNDCTHVSYGKACAHVNEYGNSVWIKTSDGRIEIYGHLKLNSLLVAPGESISAGQAIATMGSSGYSTGRHLHFECRKGSTKLNVNPSTYKANPGQFKYVNGKQFIKKSNVLVDGATYNIVSTANVKTCLTVNGNSKSNQAAIVLGALNAKSSEWVVHKYGNYNDMYYFTNKYTGKVLDCTGNQAKHKGSMQQYKLSGPNETQIFHITRLSNGKHTISPAYRALHINVCGSTAKNGTKIWLYTSDKNENKDVNNKTETFSFVKK